MLSEWNWRERDVCGVAGIDWISGRNQPWVEKPARRVRMEDEVNSSVCLRELSPNLAVLASSAVPWMRA